MNPAHSARIRRALFIALQLAVTGLAIFFVLRSVDIAETRRSFTSADYWWLVPAVAFLVADLGLRAVRWRLLLAPQRGLSLRNLFGAQNVGYLVNNILPLRAGELARLLVLDELELTGKVRAGASIAIERGIDLVAMVVLAAMLFPFIDEPGWARGPALALGAGVVAGFIVLCALAHLNERGRDFWRPFVRAVPRFGDRLEELADLVFQGFHPLLRWRVLGQVLLLTAVLWSCAALSFFMVIQAFGLSGGFAAAALVLAATTLVMVVPSSPGYIGVFEGSAVTALTSVFAVSHEAALSYAIAQHALIVFVPSMLGVAFLISRRTVFYDLVASLRGDGAPTEPAPAASPHADVATVGTAADL